MNNFNDLHANHTVNVHELHQNQPLIGAEDFRSPLVRRLAQTDVYQDGEAIVTNSFRSEDGTMVERIFCLRWLGLADDHRKCINTYQEPVITEFATIGLACIFMNNLIGQEITEVTMRGQKADYWIGDREAMLEISGQQDGDIDSLCQNKSIQLLENPFGQNGYVCVAIFNDRQARFWYYEQPAGVNL
jgi:hypothetical protein